MQLEAGPEGPASQGSCHAGLATTTAQDSPAWRSTWQVALPAGAGQPPTSQGPLPPLGLPARLFMPGLGQVSLGRTGGKSDSLCENFFLLISLTRSLHTSRSALLA